MKLLHMFCSFPFVLVGVLNAQGIVNGDFDLGRTGWTESSKGNYTLIGTAAFFASTEVTPPVIPHSGQYMGRIGGFGYEINSLSQTVTLPNTNPVYLKLYVQDRNSTTSECAGLWVGAQIRVTVAGQKIYDTYLCRYNQLETWTPVYFDLTAAAGQSVQIIFQADAANSVWSFLYLDDVRFTNQITDVKKEKSLLPMNIELKQNYPNPFNPSTTIRYSLPSSTKVKLTVYDLLGREIATLVNEEQSAGWKEVQWNAQNVASGMYLMRLTALQRTGGQAGSFSETKKVLLMK